MFVSDAVCIAQTSFCQGSNARVQRFVHGFWLPVPTWFTGFFHQVVDVLDNNLLLFVAKHHSAQHLVFAQQFSFGFNHQYCSFGTGNNQIQLTFFQLILSRVQYILVVDVTHTSRTDRTVEWNA
ncbi:hypothetical protein D3C72_2038890 [compost metagenome]